MFYKIIKFFLPVETSPPMTKDQELGLFSQLYENPTFRKYLDARENYLIQNGMEEFIGGKLNSAKGLAGQLLEIRNMRMRVKTAYLSVEKLRQSKKQNGLQHPVK